MIVNLHKYLIYGNKSEMDRFFKLAQRAGFIEFIGLSHKKALELPEDAKKILAAIKIARQHTPTPLEPHEALPDPEKIAEQVLAIHEESERLFEEQRLLIAEISRIAAFGDFSRKELDQLEVESKRVFQFFCMKSDLAKEVTLPPEVLYVGTEYDLSYFVSINKERAQYPKMIEILIDRPVGELRERLHFVREEISKREKELHNTAKYLHYLQSGLLDSLNDFHLRLAKHDAASPLGENLFAIEGWIPETKIKALYGLLSGLSVDCEEIAIEAKDVKPTYMENKGAAKLGEDLVHVYDTPAATDKDPSVWILVFFALFFAMIISDAGYGLIYLATGLILKWKFPKAVGGFQRFIKTVILIGSCCIVWGILTASFFGIEIGPDNPFRRTSFLHYLAVKKAEYHMAKKDDVYQEAVKMYPEAPSAADGHDLLLKASKTIDGHVKYELLEEFIDNLLLEFSLLIGVIHLTLSFIRYMGRNPVGVGWICFMFGGYLFFPSVLKATSLLNILGLPKEIAYPVGKQMLFGGLALVLLISLLQKKKWGALHELTNAIQVFADVLSYLRLYALALAGMIMANTFNSMGMQVGILGGGFVIIIIGHVVNLSLSVMAGTIHGLRLNFLEWYHYSFEGGGKLFNPLRLTKVK